MGTRANRAVEIAVTQTMVDRVERRFDLRPQRLAGDTAYGAVRLLKWLVDRNITPHIPVWDKSARPDGTFSRADFLFDHERNVYICPSGSELTSTGNIDQGHIVYYRASKSNCSRCSLKPKCTTAIVRKITRDLNEDVRDRVRALANTEAFQQSRRERKKVEMRFAHMKRILKLDRFRLRGLSGVRNEVLLTARAQNLRRLAKLLCRPPPSLAGASVAHVSQGIIAQLNSKKELTQNKPQKTQRSLQLRPAEFCNAIEGKADLAVDNFSSEFDPDIVTGAGDLRF